MTDFSYYSIGSFRAGSHKSACWIARADQKIFHVDDDSTTYAYAVDNDVSIGEFTAWVRGTELLKHGFSADATIRLLDDSEVDVTQPEIIDEE